MPLTELWNEHGTISKERIRWLAKSDLAELLRAGPLQFVVADFGIKLMWVPAQQRFEFWKTVKLQIADRAKPIYREQFPKEMAYIASEWRGSAGECLILLERYH
jgi:hypothetical protein